MQSFSLSMQAHFQRRPSSTSRMKPIASQCRFGAHSRSSQRAHFLQENRLHEVHTGGLSSYSVINLVIAHLMAQGYSLQNDVGAGVDKDLGNLLWGFFDRFGNLFDYHDEAVSIQQVCSFLSET